MSGMETRALELYRGAEARLRARYDALSTEAVIGPMADHLPDRPGRALDIGAGSGRDARWLTAAGHAVTAVDPVFAPPAKAGTIRWLRDRLPALAALGTERFDIVLVSGVWHHLDTARRDRSWDRIAGLLAECGRLILSLRHGPLPSGDAVAPLDPDTEIARAGHAGLRLLAREDRLSIQTHNIAADVHWTWLCFTPGDPT